MSCEVTKSEWGLIVGAIYGYGFDAKAIADSLNVPHHRVDVVPLESYGVDISSNETHWVIIRNESVPFQVEKMEDDGVTTYAICPRYFEDIAFSKPKCSMEDLFSRRYNRNRPQGFHR